VPNSTQLKLGLFSYRLSAKEWMQNTNGIDIISKAGRYGGKIGYHSTCY